MAHQVTTKLTISDTVATVATVKATKMRYFDHITRINGSCLEKEITQGTLPERRTRVRAKISWMDNNLDWT